MNANEHEFLDALIERVDGAVYEVANTLGVGFLEKVARRNSRFHFRFLTKVSA